MTDREKAIVMAYTGITMLTGDKCQIFHEYVEEIMGRPIWTHEIGLLADEIKEKSKGDFLALCEDESSSEWTPVSYRMPIVGENVLICDLDGNMYVSYLHAEGRKWGYDDGGDKIKNIIAWQPLPIPYTESEQP